MAMVQGLCVVHRAECAGQPLPVDHQNPTPERCSPLPDELELTAIDPLDSVLASASEVAEQSVDPMAEVLPTTDVKWENFERLLLRMGHKILGLRDVKRFGSRGQAQKGIDVIGLDTDRNAVAIQSKRYQNFTKANLDAAVKEFLGSKFPFPVNHLIIGVACEVTERSIIERVTELNAMHPPLRIEIWDQERISELLRDQPEIVIEFFGSATAQRFCHPHVITPLPVPSADAVATADAVMRGPLRAVGVDQQLQQARANSAAEFAEALQLYEEVQKNLRERGFAGHAADLDIEILPLLVRADRTGDARTLIMRKIWQAERSGESHAAQICQGELTKLLSAHSDLSADSAWQAVAWVARIVVDSLSTPVPHQIAADLDALGNFAPGDRARLLLLIAESGLGNDDTDRISELTDQLQSAATAVSDDVSLKTRLLTVIADADGDWVQLIRAARISLPKEAAALVHARRARFLVLKGDYQEALDEWGEAIDNACLTRRHEDAVKWLYSKRAIESRYSGIFSDRSHRLAREIANLPG